MMGKLSLGDRVLESHVVGGCCYPQSGCISRSPKSGLVVSDLQWDYSGGTRSSSSSP